MDDLEVAIEEAHKDYLKRRNEILTKLECIRTSGLISNKIMNKWIKQTIDFIKEGEV